jgi:hypothetical protein
MEPTTQRDLKNENHKKSHHPQRISMTQSQLIYTRSHNHLKSPQHNSCVTKNFPKEYKCKALQGSHNDHPNSMTSGEECSFKAPPKMSFHYTYHPCATERHDNKPRTDQPCKWPRANLRVDPVGSSFLSPHHPWSSFPPPCFLGPPRDKP